MPNNSELYISKIEDQKEDIFDNVVIDPYSLELLKKGNKKQRYAVVGWVDEETKQLRLYFRPSFKEGKEDENRKVFDPEDIVEAREGLTGIVHQRVIEKVIKRAHRLGHTEPFLLTGKKIGLSFYKNSEHLLLWSNRSTLNSEMFKVNPLGYYALYFDEEIDFTRPGYTNALQIERSLPIGATWKIINKVKSVVLGDDKLSEEEKKLEQSNLEENEKECLNKVDEDEWNEIKKDKTRLAECLMKTIFIASGLEKSLKQSPWPQPENWVVIKNTLEEAKKNNIKLDLEYFHPDFVEDWGNKTALMHAARVGDEKSVKLLLEAKANVNCRDKKQCSSLGYAIQASQLKMITILMEAKADINLPGEDGDTPLCLAIKMENSEIARFLIEAKADIKLRNLQAESALSLAIENNLIDIAQLLIQKKADINQPDKRKKTLLWKAINQKNIAGIKILLELNAKVNNSNDAEDTPIWQAVKKGNAEILKMLIQAEADVNQSSADNGLTPISLAARNNETEAIAVLLEAKADVNKGDQYEQTPIFWATSYGHADAVQVLIDAKGDFNKPNFRGRTPLHSAIDSASFEAINLLLEFDNILLLEKDNSQKTPFDYLSQKINLATDQKADFEEVQAKMILKMLKKYIEIHPWKAKPIIDAKLLNSTTIADLAWTKKLEKLISLATLDEKTSQVTQTFNLFSLSQKEPENEIFLSWFSSKENLIKQLLEALSHDLKEQKKTAIIKNG